MSDHFSSGDAEDCFYMDLALREARMACERGEIPVGAVIVHRGEVIGRGHNRREEMQSPTAHAEIMVLEAASLKLGTWRLQDSALYVTLEPCLMCAGALLQARISRLVFGCLDPKGGAVESLYRICEDSRLNHRVAVKHGILEEECGKILTDFFSRLRKKEQSAFSDQEGAISREALSPQRRAEEGT